MGNLEQALKELPFTDLEGEYEEIKRLNKLIVEKDKLIDELVKENSQYKRVLEEVRDQANQNYWG